VFLVVNPVLLQVDITDVYSEKLTLSVRDCGMPAYHFSGKEAKSVLLNGALSLCACVQQRLSESFFSLSATMISVNQLAKE
jgi:hypothetical protein